MPAWGYRYDEGEIEHETYFLDLAEAGEVFFEVLLTHPLGIPSYVDLHEFAHMINNSSRITIGSLGHHPYQEQISTLPNSFLTG
jgi:hypothetical protein